MKRVHGIIHAYHGYSELRELGSKRTGASMPFCGRYRLIDFPMSSLMNAGVTNVGIIMQKGYQSLLGHMGSGRAWNMERRTGGLTLLPPYGIADASSGVYVGCMDALNSVRSYLRDSINEPYVVLMRGDLCANIDLEKAIDRHVSTGVDITAVCTSSPLSGVHHSYIVGKNGVAEQLLCLQTENVGVQSLETYIMSKDLLIEVVEWCAHRGCIHLHRDAIMHLMNEGKKIGIYMHDGYARMIKNVLDYYEANMDMLDDKKRALLFPPERNVTTRRSINVSTYYGDEANVKNSLVADGCVVEGDVENCVLFPGVKLAAGSVLKNCIIMNDTVIGPNVELNCVIADKDVNVSSFVSLTGNPRLPLVIPNRSRI